MSQNDTGWVDDLEIHPGDHIIAIITRDEDMDMLPPYVAHGLSEGNLLSVVASPKRVESLKQSFPPVVDVSKEVEDERLLFIDPAEVGDKEGRFDADVFIERVTEFIDAQAAAGVEHVRNIGVMDWLADAACTEDALYLEARLNQVFEERPVSGF